jgi:hypothetical protein
MQTNTKLIPFLLILILALALSLGSLLYLRSIRQSDSLKPTQDNPSVISQQEQPLTAITPPAASSRFRMADGSAAPIVQELPVPLEESYTTSPGEQSAAQIPPILIGDNGFKFKTFIAPVNEIPFKNESNTVVELSINGPDQQTVKLAAGQQETIVFYGSGVYTISSGTYTLELTIQ